PSVSDHITVYGAQWCVNRLIDALKFCRLLRHQTIALTKFVEKVLLIAQYSVEQRYCFPEIGHSISGWGTVRAVIIAEEARGEPDILTELPAIVQIAFPSGLRVNINNHLRRNGQKEVRQHFDPTLRIDFLYAAQVKDWRFFRKPGSDRNIVG